MGQNFGFVKVAAAIPRVEIADCIYNEREIYNQIIEAVIESSGKTIICTFR